ncbi:MAG: hypothetical protein VB084_16795 [Syntrophomonadaceae bacterium]|nr:hypothetical protein [Syntrophomonadaceae bacterium]
MKIGVKFCGGCNPYIDRKNIIDKVKNLLPPGEYTFEYFDFDGCDLFVVINGCSLSCAKYEEAENVVTVCGLRIDGQQYIEEDLPVEVARRLLAMSQVQDRS